MVKISKNGFGVKKLKVVANTKEVIAINVFGLAIIITKRGNSYV